MPCYHPRLAYRELFVNHDTGKRGITFNPNKGFQDLPIIIPCRQCIGCKLRYSYQWATRCHHEAQMHEENSYITLTFDQKHLPADYSLNTRDFQLFIKRLRKKISPQKVRYFHAGEYGEKTLRPHHHACLFGYQFPDLKLHTTQDNGFPLYTSKILTDTWGQGHCWIGQVTFESAAYVARYIMKKINGPPANDHYNGRKPEFTTMSKKPGIGFTWFQKFKSDVYPHDYVQHRNKKFKPPSYYDTLLELSDKSTFDKIKLNRVKHAIEAELDPDNSLLRLSVREKCKIAQTKSLTRKL